MKEIRIITFNNAHNYGAILQEYALIKKIQDLGNNVRVINYQNNVIGRHYKIITFRGNFAKSLVKNIFFYIENKKRYLNFKKFENFKIAYTDEVYNKEEDFKQNPPHADIYITGSDQVWNAQLTEGLKDSYTLNFGDKSVKRISYAASIGNFFMEYLEKDIRANKNSNYIYNKKGLMNKIFLTDYFCGFVWNKIYKTSIIKKNKIIFKNNIHICEDLLFNCQYFSFIKKGFYTEDKLYHYIQHANSSYNSLNYNSRWNTVVDAYEKIKLYIEKDNMNFEFSYLSAVLNLKERIIANKIRNENLIEVVNEKIKENEKRILMNKDLSISNKLKIIVKINAIYIFMIFKKIKYNFKK